MQKKGFTLIEILVAMAITAIIVLIVNNFLITGFRSASFNQELEDAVENARKAMDTMIVEIRGMNNLQQGNPILQISTSTLIFYSDINKDGLIERVKYYISGNDLKRDFVKPPYSSSPTTTAVLASYLNNYSDPVFNYYDSNGATTTDINNITLINILLKIDVNPERSPKTYNIQSDIQIRNLKNN